MRLDSLLKKSLYVLPENWVSLSQKEMKLHMLSHIKTTCTEEVRDIFLTKLATCSDQQYGNLCVRLARHQSKKETCH
ncbi:hypothetical protein CN918_30505 [Priestia megaterium]|nr:hypothetical protein CN918_30505 [Priestia megaterium]